MKVKKSTFFCFIVLISLFGLNLSAQETDSSRFQAKIDEPFELDKPEKIRPVIEHDLRIGIDVHNYILGAITPIRTGLDLLVEYNITSNIFVVVEGGYNYFKRENVRITYISKGNYIRTGIDYNLRKATAANDRDMYFIGFRYGFSNFNQEVPEYVLVNGYWGNSTGSMSAEDGYAHWAEVLTGFKVEVIKNWYLGMSVRLKFFLKRSKNAIEPVQYVPGYARNYNSGVMDFNYSISYNIPLNYKKKKIAVYDKK